MKGETKLSMAVEFIYTKKKTITGVVTKGIFFVGRVQPS